MYTCTIIVLQAESIEALNSVYTFPRPGEVPDEFLLAGTFANISLPPSLLSEMANGITIEYTTRSS